MLGKNTLTGDGTKVERSVDVSTEIQCILFDLFDFCSFHFEWGSYFQNMGLNAIETAETG